MSFGKPAGMMLLFIMCYIFSPHPHSPQTLSRGGDNFNTGFLGNVPYSIIGYKMHASKSNSCEKDLCWEILIIKLILQV
jgi:hypothetical protein